MRTSLTLIAALWIPGSMFAQEPPTTPAASPQPGRPAEERLVPALVSEPRELFLKGVELFESGNFAQARTVFKALTLAFPEMPEPHVNLAVVLAAEGDEAGSANSAESALMAHPVCRAAFGLELLRDLTTIDAAPRPASAAPVSAPPVVATARSAEAIRSAISPMQTTPVVDSPISEASSE